VRNDPPLEVYIKNRREGSSEALTHGKRHASVCVVLTPEADKRCGVTVVAAKLFGFRQREDRCERAKNLSYRVCIIFMLLLNSRITTTWEKSEN
jgi:hypothetical protein